MTVRMFVPPTGRSGASKIAPGRDSDFFHPPAGERFCPQQENNVHRQNILLYRHGFTSLPGLKNDWVDSLKSLPGGENKNTSHKILFTLNLSPRQGI
jgi:hypothetical protein